MTEPQHRYVALLRAINVGGHSILKMGDLRKRFESMGFFDVTTYIQTGNVVFSASEEHAGTLVRLIETNLASLMGHRVPVLVLTRSELEAAASHNPFDPANRHSEQRCHLMFLAAQPNAANQKALMALEGKEYRFHVRGKVLYYAYSRKFDGIRRNIDFEKVLGAEGTSRTWQVVNKLIELLG